MKKTLDELKAEINEFVGARDDDQALQLLENVADTFPAYNVDSQEAEIERLKTENDDLRQRYRERFGNADPETTPDPEPEPQPEPEPDIEDLFEEKEEK